MQDGREVAAIDHRPMREPETHPEIGLPREHCDREVLVLRGDVEELVLIERRLLEKRGQVLAGGIVTKPEDPLCVDFLMVGDVRHFVGSGSTQSLDLILDVGLRLVTEGEERILDAHTRQVVYIARPFLGRVRGKGIARETLEHGHCLLASLSPGTCGRHLSCPATTGQRPRPWRRTGRRWQ